MATYRAPDLIAFAEALLLASGLEREKAGVFASVLVEGDLLGHTTHGLHHLPPYLAELEKGAMAKSGEPRVVSDYPAAVTWDGMRLPGPWLTVKAIDLASARAKVNGTCTVIIRRSHHIGCLAAYLKRVTDQGLGILLMCSDPTVRSVAPHGGRREVYTPNPLAAAWPTAGDPVMIDVSMSITTNAMTRRLYNEKRRMPGPWVIDGQGRPSDDPAVLFADPPGSLLPMGGIDHGHKGYALALLVETLTGGLSGHGRADPPDGWGANVYVQIFVPALFGGLESFVRQTSFVADACRATPPRPGFDRVRLPGEAGLRRREAQLRDGVDLYPSIMPALAPWAEKLRVAPPPPL